MRSDWQDLLRPSRLAVLGDEAACTVVQRCLDGGYTGKLWPVHATRTEMAGVPCIASLDQLPEVPDVCVLALDDNALVEPVRTLAAMGVGGVVCLPGDLAETAEADDRSSRLQHELANARGDMPIIGPGALGFINYLDGLVLWSAQHGGIASESGVGLICQSASVALNLSMQRRGLPLAYLLTTPSESGPSLGELGEALLADKRVTVIGLQIEAFDDIRALENMARRARVQGVAIVALKLGRVARARANSLPGSRTPASHAAASDAFLDRLGIVRVSSLAVFLDTLLLLHVRPSPVGHRLVSICGSDSEAMLLREAGEVEGLTFPALSDAHADRLPPGLVPDGALNNPINGGRALCGDDSESRPLMRVVSESDADVLMLVIDLPREDRCDARPWRSRVAMFVEETRGFKGARVVLSTLPEGMPESLRNDLVRQGVVPLSVVEDACAVIAAASQFRWPVHRDHSDPVWLPDPSTNVLVLRQSRDDDSTSRPTPTPLIGRSGNNVASIHAGLRREVSAKSGPGDVDDTDTAQASMPTAWQGSHPQDASQGGTFRRLDESTAKRWLMRFGTVVPRGLRLSFADVRSPRRLSAALDKLTPIVPWPVVVKGLGVAHKSESNAIVLNIDNRRELELAIRQIDCAGGCLIEEQLLDGVAELFVCVVQDPVHGLLLSVGAGGVLSELLDDVAYALLPIDRTQINSLINQLRCAPMLSGVRNQPVVDREMLVDAVDSLQQAALQLGERLVELEINPLICSADACVAVDALVTVHDPGASDRPVDAS